MAVKIDNSNNPLLLAPSREGRARSAIEKSGDNAPATAASGTSVNIGSTSAQLRKMESGTENIPLNASKLAEVKQAISEGHFQVNSSAVADSLIKSVIELISSQQA